MLLWLLRGCFAALMLAVAVFAFNFLSADLDNTLGGAVAALAILATAGAILYTDARETDKQIATISSIYFGLLFGLMLGWLFGMGIEALLQTFSGALQLDPPQLQKMTILARILITLITSYISISILIQTRDDFRFIIPYVEFNKQVKGGRPLVLDTSVIIDGRIADLCDTRLVDTKIIVPRFVLQELQGIADSSDKLKRNRGRRGLDILKKLQSNPKIDLLMHDGNAGEIKPGEKMRVDERLVLFTKAVGGRVVTNDFNLNKIAQLQGVDVINLNEVANSLKTVALPGEYLTLKVVKVGDQLGQGVGYLEDGTMVVIESGRNLVGQDTSIVVTSVLQTPAGRMIFGRPEQRQSGSYVPVGQSGTHPTAPPSPPETPKS